MAEIVRKIRCRDMAVARTISLPGTIARCGEGTPVVDASVSALQGTAISALGEALGYYRALAAAGLTPAELAAKTATNERFARDWLARQAARGQIHYDAHTGRYFFNREARPSVLDWKGDPPGA